MRPPLSPPVFRDLPLADGYVARGRFWPPAAPAADIADSPTAQRVGILYLHGIQSHGGWYEWSASLLAQVTGCPVLLPDRRGSGLNTVARGDVPQMQCWLADIDDHAAWLMRECDVSAIALVGVSWGGKSATAWALQNPQRCAALLLIAPGVFPQVDVRFDRKIGVGLSLLTRPERQFPIPLDDPALFTGNPAGRAFIAADPLKLSTVSARFLYESTRLDRLLIRATAGALRAPASLLLAERDQIIRNAPTERWLRRICAAPPLINTIAGGQHTLEYEMEVRAFEAALAGWVGACSNSHDD